MSRRQGIIVIIGFLLAFTLGVTVKFPAAKALELIPLPPEVRLQGVSGNVFDGAVKKIEVAGFALSQVRYRLLPSCLLGLQLCVNLQSDVEDLDANVRRALYSSNINIVSSRMKLPSGLLDQVPNMLVKPKGDFILRVESLQLSEKGQLLGVQAVVDWQGASLEGEEQVLGDFRADVNSSAEGVNIRLSANPENPLGADGEVNLTWQGRYTLDLSLTTRSGLNSSLRGAVDSFARKSGLNRYRVKQGGQLLPVGTRILQKLKPTQG